MAPSAWQPPLAIRLSAGLHGTAAGLLALHPAWWPPLLAAIAGNHLAFAAAGVWPRSQLLGPCVHRAPEDGDTVALTFDDGPDRDVTPAVLDLLAASGARASFFCIGRRAARHPALVRRILAEGHAVENHSHTHPNHFACLAGRALRDQIVSAQSAIADAGGAAPTWFRAPMGIRNPLLDPALAGAGLRLASWTRRGYDTRCADAVLVCARLHRGLARGDVLLMHDGNSARDKSGRAVVLDALPRLLEALKAAGLRAVPLGREAAIESRA